jgi:hypothetical protein
MRRIKLLTKPIPLIHRFPELKHVVLTQSLARQVLQDSDAAHKVAYICTLGT